MWITIGKLEFKKGFVYYFILYSFFLFWTLFTLFGAFFHSNINKVINEYFREVGISFFIYPQDSQKLEESQLIKLKELKYVKRVELIPPKRLLEEIQKDFPISLDLDEETLSSLPSLIRVWIKSPSQWSQLQRDLQRWQQFSKASIEILGSPLSQPLNFWEYLNKILIVILFLWNSFYFLFLYFLNKSLNSYLRKQLDTFQLLGGHVIKLKFIRFFLLVIPFALIYLFSFSIYYFLTQTLITLFPILEFFPNTSNSLDIFIFIIYFSFIIIIYPLFIVFISYRKI